MSIVKVVEVIAESPKSWEDAAQNAVTEASRSVRNIRHLYVEGMQAIVEKNRIVRFRVNAKLSLVVEE